jgi:hypothetical protein
MQVGLIALVVAACGGTSPAPSPSAATITTHVTFDGQECTYDGPATVPGGTRLVFVFENTPAAVETSTVKGVVSIGSELVVIPVPAGSEVPTPAGTRGTWTDPMWTVSGFAAYGPGPSATVPVVATEAAYYVGCHQYWEKDWDQIDGVVFAFYPATVIQVES